MNFSSITETAGNIIIIIGIIFMFFGVLGIFKFRNFYQRILIIAKIDTVGVITLIAGIALKHGISFFTLKLLLLVLIILIINPLASHMIGHSAYLNGYNIEDGHIKDEHIEEEHF